MNTLATIFRRVTATVFVLAILGAVAAVSVLFWYFRHREAPGPAPAAGEVSLPRGTRSVTLFFAAASGDSLVSEQRQILESDRVSETVQTLITELVRGPSAGGGRPLFPAGITVRHVFFDESGDVYVDFSSGLATRFRGGSTAEYLLLASLVRTLALNLPTVTAVTVTVDARPVATLGGHFSLEGPLAVSEWR